MSYEGLKYNTFFLKENIFDKKNGYEFLAVRKKGMGW